MIIILKILLFKEIYNNLNNSYNFPKAVFASWIPEITELAAQRSKYGGKYNKDVRKRYTGKCCTK